MLEPAALAAIEAHDAALLMMRPEIGGESDKDAENV